MVKAGASWMLPGLQHQDRRCHCLLFASFTDGYMIYEWQVSGAVTTRATVQLKRWPWIRWPNIFPQWFMYWFASISINWTTKTERLIRQSPLGAEIKSRLYIISRCILMLIRWHDWRRTDLDDILIPCLNLILCKNILVLSIVYIFS